MLRELGDREALLERGARREDGHQRDVEDDVDLEVRRGFAVASHPGEVEVVPAHPVEQGVGGRLHEPDLDVGVGAVEVAEQRGQVDHAAAADHAHRDPSARQAGELVGRAAGLHGLLGIVTDVAVRHVFVDGPDVCTVYDLHTTAAGPILTVNWAWVDDGLVRTIRAVFDPRPLLG